MIHGEPRGIVTDQGISECVFYPKELFRRLTETQKIEESFSKPGATKIATHLSKSILKKPFTILRRPSNSKTVQFSNFTCKNSPSTIYSLPKYLNTSVEVRGAKINRTSKNSTLKKPSQISINDTSKKGSKSCGYSTLNSRKTKVCWPAESDMLLKTNNFKSESDNLEPSLTKKVKKFTKSQQNTKLGDNQISFNEKENVDPRPNHSHKAIRDTDSLKDPFIGNKIDHEENQMFPEKKIIIQAFQPYVKELDIEADKNEIFDDSSYLCTSTHNFDFLWGDVLYGGNGTCFMDSKLESISEGNRIELPALKNEFHQKGWNGVFSETLPDIGSEEYKGLKNHDMWSNESWTTEASEKKEEVFKYPSQTIQVKKEEIRESPQTSKITVIGTHSCNNFKLEEGTHHSKNIISTSIKEEDVRTNEIKDSEEIGLSTKYHYNYQASLPRYNRLFDIDPLELE